MQESSSSNTSSVGLIRTPLHMNARILFDSPFVTLTDFYLSIQTVMVFPDDDNYGLHGIDALIDNVEAS